MVDEASFRDVNDLVALRSGLETEIDVFVPVLVAVVETVEILEY
jgi:IMP dehydrogenase/GMP reductase